MDKHQLIAWIRETFPDNTLFEEPVYSMEQPTVVDYRKCGTDHDGLTVLRANRFDTTGKVELNYRVGGQGGQ